MNINIHNEVNEITTTDLSKFGWREWSELRRILDAMIDKGLPEEFDNSNIHAMFNKNSGNVFLTNDECQVAMMNGDKLELFYSCPECGHEGFKDQMGKKDGHGYADKCAEYLRDIGILD